MKSEVESASLDFLARSIDFNNILARSTRITTFNFDSINLDYLAIRSRGSRLTRSKVSSIIF